LIIIPRSSLICTQGYSLNNFGRRRWKWWFCIWNMKAFGQIQTRQLNNCIFWHQFTDPVTCLCNSLHFNNIGRIFSVTYNGRNPKRCQWRSLSENVDRWLTLDGPRLVTVTLCEWAKNDIYNVCTRESLLTRPSIF